MARGTTAGTPIRHRLGDALPAMFLEDEFIQRFCDGLDEVLAPVPSALDNFAAILDPALTPPDFLDWLGGWVGIAVDRTVPVERQRRLVAEAALLYRRRGTVSGLADLVELFVGVRPEIVEGGAVACSLAPGRALPGSDGAPLVVRLPMRPPGEVVEARIDALITAHKPAHVRHLVEYRAGPALGPPTGSPG